MVQKVVTGYFDPTDLKTFRQSGGGRPPAVAEVTPAISNGAAYSANDVIGGKITLANAVSDIGAGAVLHSLAVIDRGNVKADLTFLFFRDNPSANLADNAAFAFSGGDEGLLLGWVDVANSDYKTINAVGLVTLRNLGFVVKGGASTSLYVYVLTVGTPTYTGVGQLTFKFGVIR